jgi:hypothetical protein
MCSSMCWDRDRTLRLHLSLANGRVPHGRGDLEPGSFLLIPQSNSPTAPPCLLTVPYILFLVGQYLKCRMIRPLVKSPYCAFWKAVYAEETEEVRSETPAQEDRFSRRKSPPVMVHQMCQPIYSTIMTFEYYRRCISST